MKHIKKKISIGLFVILVTGCSMDFEKKKRLVPPFYKLDDAVSAVKTLKSYERYTHEVDGETPLSLVHVGSEDKPALLFIHGSPGSWEAWAEYLHDLELRSNALMVAVDRPGFGGSDNGTSGMSLKAQATAIKNALTSRFPNQKQWIVVGHSYGGPVALRLAVDYPQTVSSALLLAPAISPKLVRVRWYNRLVALPVVRSLISTSLVRSNDEMFLLSGELLQMKPLLKGLEMPIRVIQGLKDGIVHPDNAEFAEKEITNAAVETILLEKRGHFLVWEEFGFIKKTILDNLTSAE